MRCDKTAHNGAIAAPPEFQVLLPNHAKTSRQNQSRVPSPRCRDSSVLVLIARIFLEDSSIQAVAANDIAHRRDMKNLRTLALSRIP
jgi:hypothetical protein